MRSPNYILSPFFLFFFLCSLACSPDNHDDFVITNNPDRELPAYSNTPERDSLIEVGKMNAIKKARQMTDIRYSPLNPIKYNMGEYSPGRSVKGIIYSSVKEIGTYVGNNVSFHTFMTAIHNPRSKIYTDQIDQPPYHGLNCKAYYGTVCSDFVSYALGLWPTFYSHDFPTSELMQKVDHSSIDNLQVADVLWKKGHVGIITGIEYDINGAVSAIEVSEAIQYGCRRHEVSKLQFPSFMRTSFTNIFRYTELFKNTSYTPCPEFVAVMDEETIPFAYNDDLCVDKGDKSCYQTGEEVIVNIMHEYDYLEVYKDNELYCSITDNINDISLENLPYGDYKACISLNGTLSDFTYWKVVDIQIRTDRKNNRVYFSSKNAKPETVCFSTIAGSRQNPATKLYNHLFTPEELASGSAIIPQNMTMSDYPYLKILFSTDYGVIQSKLINWFE